MAQSSSSAAPSRRLTGGLLSEFAGVDYLSTVYFPDVGGRDGHYGQRLTSEAEDLQGVAGGLPTLVLVDGYNRTDVAGL